MRSWWKSLGIMGVVAGFAFGQTAARGQFPPGGGGGMPPMPAMPTSMGPPPTAFGGNPAMMGQPACFPNPAVPSPEPVSPFSIKDEGLPNAFSELVDNRGPRPSTIVFRSEYLGWWIRSGPVNAPLVSTTTNFAGGELGAAGEPGTVFLVPAGTKTVDYGYLNGVRASFGIACDFCPPIEISGFSFTRNAVVFNGGSTDGSGTYLARPVRLVDVAGVPGVGLNTVEFVNVPGFAAGQIDVLSRLSFWNFETNVYFNCADNGVIRLDLILGYRHTELNETLEINSRITGINAGINFGGVAFGSGASTFVRDSFRGRNVFEGGQVGIRSIFDCHSFKIFADFKLAMGVNHSYLDIDGSSELSTGVAGASNSTLPGGVLALPSNIGHYSQSNFSLIPEVSLSMSYQATSCLRLYGGYNLLYWTEVLRPGEHVTNAIDSRQVPTDQNYIANFRGIAPSGPALQFRDFLAHGFFAGIEIGY